jgi:hypothetical protein
MLFMVDSDVGTGVGTELYRAQNIDIEIKTGRKSASSILTPAVAIFGHNTGSRRSCGVGMSPISANLSGLGLKVCGDFPQARLSLLILVELPNSILR